jgi:uncharacterized protein (TIGR03546 family)
MPDRKTQPVAGINSPHQLALGVAFGVLIGLVPKESAIPWMICLLFLLSRANLLTGIVAALVVSVISPLLDVYSDQIGFSILTVEALQASYAAAMEIPFLAWTQFDNTVVTGSVAIGLLGWVPVYLISQVFFRTVGIAVIKKFMQLPVVRFIFGDTATEPDSLSNENPFVAES